MRIMKRMTGFLLVFACLFSMAAYAGVSKSSALKTARKIVPKTYKLTEVERDDDTGDWELEFFSPHYKIEYEVNINSRTGAVRRVEKDWKGPRPSGNMKISKARAITIASRQFRGITITGIKKQKDNGRWIWRVMFDGTDCSGLIMINAIGKIQGWEKKFK